MIYDHKHRNRGIMFDRGLSILICLCDYWCTVKDLAQTHEVTVKTVRRYIASIEKRAPVLVERIDDGVLRYRIDPSWKFKRRIA